MTTTYTGLRAHIRRTYHSIATKTLDKLARPCLYAEVPFEHITDIDRHIYRCSPHSQGTFFYLLDADSVTLTVPRTPSAYTAFLAQLNLLDSSIHIQTFTSVTASQVASLLAGTLHAPADIPDEYTYGDYKVYTLPPSLHTCLHPKSYSVEAEGGEKWVLFKVQSRAHRLLRFKELAVLLSDCYLLLDPEEQKMKDVEWSKRGYGTKLPHLVQLLQARKRGEEEDDF